ncbi:MAG: excinuclease ABC subunit UvrC [Mogibacterium sp.]|nr:excinuclease ABC subunit UvrC [Lachnospiraceae bacterium]MBR3377687.1 excinuclease ABC subunit UvrC [Mogibacterium sp.]
MFDISEELKKLPKTPGVYMHKDSLGEVIYVGKAVNLRNRVSSYFRTSQTDPKVRAMVSNVAEFEYISCATEMEALLLECNLIKKYMPRYNILLKDDKSYPYIEITTNEEFPRVISTRRLERDGNRYFGPYSDAGAVKRILGMIDEMYTFKKCRQQEFKKGVRPCLNYFIGKCPGVCTGEADKSEYNEKIGEVIDILSGRDSAVMARLKADMEKASEEMRYEDAARYRDYMKSLRSLGETQRATMIKDRDADVLVPVIAQKTGVVARYKVEGGKMSGREITYIRSDSEGSSAKDMLSSFIKQYYPELSILPREIILPMHIEDEELLEDFLDSINASNAEGKTDVMHRTRIIVPERGEKKAVLKMAMEDSVKLAGTLDEKAEREAERREALKAAIAGLIEYASSISGSAPLLIPEDDDREYRVEAYDISNFNGLDTVGGMVVYEGRKPVRSDYRKFKVRTAEGDDYGSLREVIYRRLKRARKGDEGFSTYPDIMFIDGGLGQVHAVKAVVDAFRIAIPVVGLAKDDAHRTRAIVFDDGREIDLRDDRLLFSYCSNIQEEVHRFAITYMSGVKGKKMIKSALEDIPGIGPKRRTELLAKFGSIRAIKNATYEELMEVDGMTSRAAESVLEFFSESDT